jgi:hypothetical protein
MEIPKLEECVSEVQWLRNLIDSLHSYRNQLPPWEQQSLSQRRIEAQTIRVLAVCHGLLGVLERPNEKKLEDRSQPAGDCKSA